MTDQSTPATDGTGTDQDEVRDRLAAVRTEVAKAVVGSASGPEDECGDAVPQVRRERTPCRPTSASQASAAGTAYQAPSPSPELVAEARNAESSGMPASAGLR